MHLLEAGVVDSHRDHLLLLELLHLQLLLALILAISVRLLLDTAFHSLS
jgi:hypothetical protein